MRTIVERLREDFHLAALPGRKMRCPKCGHKTFSVKRDLTLAHCFHSKCRFTMTLGTKSSLESHVSEILEGICAKFHSLLLSDNEVALRAQTYLIEERRIHRRVIKDAPLGVVPAKFDAARCFEDLLHEHSRRSKSANKESQARADGDHVQVEEISEKLSKCTRNTGGWLVMFYRDRLQRIVAMKFRKPYSKTFLSFKSFESSGVFGLELTNVSESTPPSPFDCSTLIVEGEFNALSLQSLARRYAKSVGRESFYIPVIAVGGVDTADLQTIGAIAKNPIICFDHDKSKAGFTLVTNTTKLFGVHAFTTPGPGSDLDKFIRGFDGDPETAWQEFSKLVQNRTFHPRSREAVAEHIQEIRKRKGREDLRREHEINAEVANIVKKDLSERGQFYHDDYRSFFFDRSTTTLVLLERDDDEYRAMLHEYGLNPTEQTVRFVTEDLCQHARLHGEHTQVHRFTYYNKSRARLYIHASRGLMYRIAREGCELVNIGSDEVLFWETRNWKPLPAMHLPSVGDTSWLDQLILSKINFASEVLTPHEQRLLILIWIYGIFFSEMLPTKPILCMVGEKGSGKTSALRQVGRLLFGSSFDVSPLPHQEGDFDVAAATTVLYALDNVDCPSPWLENRLTTASTGGTVRKRQLYTDSRMVELVFSCFLAITSRTPHFRRDDVADRLLLLHVSRLSNFVPEHDLLSTIDDNRPDAWAEIIGHLQQIVTALRDPTPPMPCPEFRMADFGAFAMRLARIAGIEDTMLGILSRASQAQSGFTLESDPVFETLIYWTAHPNNEGRELTAAQLCAELAETAQQESLEFPLAGNPKGLAQHLSHLRSNLEQYFDINARDRGGRKRFYSFRLKNGAQLPPG